MSVVFRTVKELKEILDTLPEDSVIISKSDNFELRGDRVQGACIKTCKVRKETKSFRDAFDNSYYNKEVYVSDDNGEQVVEISNMY